MADKISGDRKIHSFVLPPDISMAKGKEKGKHQKGKTTHYLFYFIFAIGGLVSRLTDLSEHFYETSMATLQLS